MSEAAFKKFGDQVKPTSLVMIDPDTVKSRPEGEYCEIPATVTASELGNKIAANMVMLGAVVAMTDVVEIDSLKSSIKDMLPPATHELNSQALEKGFDLGKECGGRLDVDWA
jgi:2-oxoglutarate ferredoxin oxidoreductase subunit gamma